MDVHRWLSTAALAMVAVHALALLGDRFVRFDLLDLVVPFLSSYRSFAVALGVLASYGALVIHMSFSWRKRIGAKAWRKLHYAAFLVFVAALLHGVLAGSDSGTPAMRALYVSSAVIVGALGSYRAAKLAWARRKSATRPPVARIAPSAR